MWNSSVWAFCFFSPSRCLIYISMDSVIFQFGLQSNTSCLLYCSNCSSVGPWEHFRWLLVPLTYWDGSIEHFPAFLPLRDALGSSCIFSVATLRISHLPKELGFHLLEKWHQEPRSETSVACCCQGVFAVRSSQVTEQGSRYTYTNPCVCTRL